MIFAASNRIFGRADDLVLTRHLELVWGLQDWEVEMAKSQTMAQSGFGSLLIHHFSGQW